MGGMAKNSTAEEPTPQAPPRNPPGHDPNGPGESENAPGHNKPEAEPREDMNDAARQALEEQERARK